MEDRNNVNAMAGGHDTHMLASIVKVVITVLFIVPLIHHSIYKDAASRDDATDVVNGGVNVSNQTDVAGEDLARQIRRMIVKQPTCPISHLQVIFSEICNELFIKRETCTPEDVHNEEKHKLPKIAAKNKSGNHEPRGAIVGYLAGGLLLTSLGAALVELYKAKSQPRAAASAKNKPPLSRKCSLADLTVLKHNRKELIRRDSILELPGEQQSKQLGRKVSRPPLRLD